MNIAVCSQWRKVSDDCWRYTTAIYLNHYQHRSYVLEDNGVLTVYTRKSRFGLGFVKHCARYVTILADQRSEPLFSIVPSMERCEKIEELSITSRSVSDDKHLRDIFSINRKIRSLLLTIQANSSVSCLETLSTDYLEEFIIHVRYYEELNEWKVESMETSIRHIIHYSPLKKLITSNICDAFLREIGRKNTLEYLSFKVEKPGKGLNHIAKLSNLQYLTIDSVEPVFRNSEYEIMPVVTDEFLEILSNGCVYLEVLKITFGNLVTDRGLLALSSLLNLKELSIENALKITDQNLVNFSHCKSLTFTCANKIKDPGVIALLSKSPGLEYLNLLGSGITIETVMVVIKEVRKRTNNICLKCDFGQMFIYMPEFGKFAIRFMEVICFKQ